MCTFQEKLDENIHISLLYGFLQNSRIMVDQFHLVLMKFGKVPPAPCIIGISRIIVKPFVTFEKLHYNSVLC